MGIQDNNRRRIACLANLRAAFGIRIVNPSEIFIIGVTPKNLT